LGSLVEFVNVEVVNVATLFKIHLTRLVGSFCCGAPFVMYVGHFQRNE